MSSLFYLLPFPGLQIAHGWEFWEQIIKKKKKKKVIGEVMWSK